MKKEKCEKNPFVALAGTIGGFLFVTVIMFLIFASHMASVLVPISWAFVVFGAILAFFTYKIEHINDPPRKAFYLSKLKYKGLFDSQFR